jgi:DtxR family Mn-dependent transcriptional regulator
VHLSDIPLKKVVKILGVLDSSDDFLLHLNKLKLQLGSVIKVIDIDDYDHTILADIDGRSLNLSNKVAQNLLVEVK